MMRTRILVAAAVVAGLAFGGTALAVTRSDPGSDGSHASTPATPLAAATSPAFDDSAGATDGPTTSTTPDDTPTTPDDSPSSPDDTPAGPEGTPASPTNMPPAGTAIGANRAVEIALARVGSGRVVKIEREFEHGRRVWSVRIETGGMETRVDVDSNSGSIVRLRTDASDDRRG
jgi:uncharacterized membrane protein YkoI